MPALVCPKCFAQSCITVDVSDGDTLACPECSDEFSLTDVQTMLESWRPILPWLLAHPARQEEAATPAAS